MKGLDSSILLGLLHGDPAVRSLLRRLEDVELATTEANLLELAWVAARTPTRLRHRQEALERLRRKLTVLPLDARAVDRVSHQLIRGGPPIPLMIAAMLGALESAGCDELFTREPQQNLGKWRLKVTRIGHSGPKTSA